MDIGKVEDNAGDEQNDEEHGWWIDVVERDAQCYECGGRGHYARNCPRGKGGGKCFLAAAVLKEGNSVGYAGGKGKIGGKG